MTENEIKLISGQQPILTKAKKSVANFKVREGQTVGIKVTLRGERMYEFVERLFNTALPRVRDFRGIPKKGFDGVGNSNLGVPDVSVFTEVDLEKLKYPFGLNLTIVTSAKTNAEAKELLSMMDVPFAR